MEKNDAFFKIINFKIIKEDDMSWSVMSTDNYNFLNGYLVITNAPTRESLSNSLYMELNDRFFDEYEIEVYPSSSGDEVEVLLTKGLPLIGGSYS